MGTPEGVEGPGQVGGPRPRESPPLWGRPALRGRREDGVTPQGDFAGPCIALIMSPNIHVHGAHERGLVWKWGLCRWDQGKMGSRSGGQAPDAELGSWYDQGRGDSQTDAQGKGLSRPRGVALSFWGNRGPADTHPNSRFPASGL